MAKRHANTPAELEGILLDGIVSGEPVEEEITADAPRHCGEHSELINPLPLPRRSVLSEPLLSIVKQGNGVRRRLVVTDWKSCPG